jgi:hypothetical protein
MLTTGRLLLRLAPAGQELGLLAPPLEAIGPGVSGPQTSPTVTTL